MTGLHNGIMQVPWANAGVGNNVLARDYAAQAVNMDPNNPQYRELMNQLNWGAQRYNSNPFGQGMQS